MAACSATGKKADYAVEMKGSRPRSTVHCMPRATDVFHMKASLSNDNEATTLPDPREGSTRIEDLIGNTPLIELKRITAGLAPGVRIFGKAEWFNPGGSVKDRAALNMIREGIRSGALTKDRVLLDATSGNTGIAYAMICGALGYRVQLCVPKNISLIRRQILESYGAELILTSPQAGSDGAIEEAIRLH